MNKKALICGFIGRENFGDELMLQLHSKMLRDLGYSVYYTTDAVFFRYIKKDYIFLNRLIEPYNMSFDLILFGGGALPLHFLAEFLIRYKTTKPETKIIASSVNILKNQKLSDFILSFYNNIFDCMIFREMVPQEISKNLKMKHCFLPDIVTTLNNPSRQNLDKTAVIIRENALPIFEKYTILPKEEFDILIMSSSDDILNSSLQNYNVKKLFKNDPLEQYHELTSYKKILSIGRFHSAICGKNDRENTCYLYPFVKDSEILKTDKNFFDWNEIKDMEKTQMQIDSSKMLFCKTGTTTENFYDYPSCSIDDYKNFIKDVLD